MADPESITASAPPESDQPRFVDEYFRKKPKKHGREWPVVDAPVLFAPTADTHAHLDMLADPALAIARAAAHDVKFIECMVDPLSDEGVVAFSELDGWRIDAELLMRQMCTRICGQGWHSIPKIRLAVGVHPHEAKGWNESVCREMFELMKDERVSAVGEIGLDYHYDLSERETQKRVFRQQLAMADEASLPVILHIREAHDDAFEILNDTGWPKAGTLLHCYTSDSAEIARWVDAGCYIAFGGAFTFKKLEEVRLACALVPEDRLLMETDAPYMTPEPFRGTECEPAHVIWTADRILGYLMPDAQFQEKADFLERVFRNAEELLNRPATEWQRSS